MFVLGKTQFWLNLVYILLYKYCTCMYAEMLTYKTMCFDLTLYLKNVTNIKNEGNVV